MKEIKTGYLQKLTKGKLKRVYLAREVFCKIYGVTPNGLAFSKQRACADAKKSLATFVYNEIGVTLKQAGELVGIAYSSIHHHLTTHDELFVNNVAYRDRYLEARRLYQQGLLTLEENNVPANGSDDREAEIRPGWDDEASVPGVLQERTD